MLTHVPTTPTSFGENISSTLCSVSSSFSEAPKIKSFSDMAVVTTLTPSFSRRRPVLKQQPCGPCNMITSAFISLNVYKDAAIGLGLGCKFITSIIVNQIKFLLDIMNLELII